MSDLTSYLFKTNAFKVCEENKPFFYTSGKIGPYFVSGHFLYGSESDANDLLDFINYELENTERTKIPQDVFEKVLFQYENNEVYSLIINSLVNSIKENFSIDEIDYISGGERRDWYFSNIVAYILKKPHITIFKDLACIESSYNFSESKVITNIDKSNVLHVADLLNYASSYFKAWIPAIEALGGKIIGSACAIDRNQGGTEKLKEAGIKPISLISIDNSLFEQALNLNIINQGQLDMLKDFTADPDATMREFLINHPEFLENALKSDEKSAKRARFCIDNDLYNLKNN